MNEEKLQALFRDPAFAAAFAAAATPEDAATLLREQQAELPMEQVK